MSTYPVDNRGVQKTCGNCGVIFVTAFLDQLYCGEHCKGSAAQKRRRMRSVEQRERGVILPNTPEVRRAETLQVITPSEPRLPGEEFPKAQAYFRAFHAKHNRYPRAHECPADIYEPTAPAEPEESDSERALRETGLSRRPDGGGTE